MQEGSENSRAEAAKLPTALALVGLLVTFPALIPIMTHAAEGEVRRTLYVSPAGLDSSDGTKAKPFRSILAASKWSQPGTVIHVAPGLYAGGFQTTASGNAGAHILYVSDVRGGARIVGAGPPEGEGAGWSNRGDYVDVRGFEIDGSGPHALKWQIGFYNGGSNCTFSNSIVHDILTDPTAYYSAESSGNGGAGILMDRYYGGFDGIADGNRVYNIGPPSERSNLVHGIYVTESGTISNNVVYNVAGIGVHLWHGAERIRILNNTIDNARAGGIEVGSGDNGGSSTTGDYVVVANNIVVNSGRGIYEWGTTGVHNIYENNQLYGNSESNVSLHHGLKALGTVIADPEFVNAAAHDYRLREDSPAFGRGALNDDAKAVLR